MTIATGHCKGSDVFQPRIPLIPSDTSIPFEFKRLQFPVRVCFAMSINKAQGQSLTVAGLYLQAPCFSHGQYYVVCTQVGSPRNLFICAPGSENRNLFTKKLFKTCRHIPVKNKHVNHFYIAIPHISELCLTVFEIIPTTALHMHGWSCQMMCYFSIGMSAMGRSPW